jgi:hypothetical protein
LVQNVASPSGYVTQNYPLPKFGQPSGFYARPEFDQHLPPEYRASFYSHVLQAPSLFAPRVVKHALAKVRGAADKRSRAEKLAAQLALASAAPGIGPGAGPASQLVALSNLLAQYDPVRASQLSMGLRKRTYPNFTGEGLRMIGFGEANIGV